MDVPLWAWGAVLALIVAALVVDLFAHRGDTDVTAREAGAWSAVWFGLGLAFSVVVWFAYGAAHAGEYVAGFLLEKSLSVDNVVVFALVLASFAIPRGEQHRILWFGVVGALVLRAVFIAGGAALLDRFHVVLYVFGVFLVVTGILMFRRRSEPADPLQSPALRWVRRVIPSVPELHGRRLVVREHGAWRATPLLLAAVAVAVADVVFAVDSIPAVFAVTREPFLVLTSNAFAVLGLRSLYFLLADLVDRFEHLRAALAVVLVLVGAKMLVADVWEVPVVLSLGVVVLALGLGVVTSLRATARRAHGRRRRPAG
jgi:tellurite resistance protein TerC